MLFLRHLELFIVKATIIAGRGRKGGGNEESSTVDRVQNDRSLVVGVSDVLNEASGVRGLSSYPIGENSATACSRGSALS